MATITIRVDDNIKQQAERLFDDLGLNMTSAINIFIKKALSVNGIPFDLRRNTYNAETLQAMLESEMLMNDPTTKTYNSFSEIMEEIHKENDTEI